MAQHTGTCYGRVMAACPACKIMRQWRQELTTTAIPAHPCIFCPGPKEDIGHMRLLCVGDQEVPRLLRGRVEEFTAELPLTDRAMEFFA